MGKNAYLCESWKILNGTIKLPALGKPVIINNLFSQANYKIVATFYCQITWGQLHLRWITEVRHLKLPIKLINFHF